MRDEGPAVQGSWNFHRISQPKAVGSSAILKMNIHLVTVVGRSVSLLEHHLQHYRDLGIDSFIIHAHALERNDDLLSEIDRIASNFGVSVASITIAPWAELINPLLYGSSLRQRPNDWFLLADQDEFHQYPCSLEDLVHYCEQRSYDYVEGCVIDRTTESGMLAPVRADTPIYEQFPVGSVISGALLGSVINKVVLTKGIVKISPGQHHARSGNGCPVSEFYIPVYHFKWIDHLLPRLEARIAEQKALGEGLWRENNRFLSHYKLHGRIHLEDPAFFAAVCDPHYPHWSRVTEWRVASRFFRWF